MPCKPVCRRAQGFGLAKPRRDSQGSLSKTAFHAYLYEKTMELSFPGGLLPVRALC